ncbi:hypothetical protein BU23DRAFT_559508 [Bimuria novae-zelandiae CBS 107.79]|uniref:Zn(2)-C6 fungal-type domain-containing protein n=1 Tax=Bimuria novae-zelandiae CBS 107.79 TaxID=1447943 RepID=A0A6A5UQ47_9PLEO|nr:hypothetical protein BU23DRAFT_559508 [Bimuria novae-zelandiae CBS 107.79]
MPERRPAGTTRPRGSYSRLICLGCRERRIRCELPSEAEIPGPGELRTVETPCYRCKKLGIPCVVRQTILGRPRHEDSTGTADLQSTKNGDIVSRIIVELPLRTVARTRPIAVQNGVQDSNTLSNKGTKLRCSHNVTFRQGDALLIHKPQSAETILIIRALDTLHQEKVEKEWFRHLPAYVGHTQALDLSIKAVVAACAYAQGIPKLTSGDCYQALALALNAVKAKFRSHSQSGEVSDDMLASVGLLAHFEGALRKHGIPMRAHVEGLGAILAARSDTYPVSPLAREIFDFHACDSAIMACIQGTPSPFEGMPRGYYGKQRIAYDENDTDRSQIKAIGSELFVRIPRLVGLVRSLRLQPFPPTQLFLDALELSKFLLMLHDARAEERLLQNVKVRPSENPDATLPLGQSLHFASVEDFEALAYYWQNRLLLLRLDQRLQEMCNSSDVQGDYAAERCVPLRFRSSFGPQTNETFRLVNNILMSADFVDTLPLRKHDRLFAHAMVVVWGVVLDMPMVLDHFQDREETCTLAEQLVRRVNVALKAKPDLTIEDIDVAADIFVGGQPRGRFVELYGL